MVGGARAAGWDGPCPVESLHACAVRVGGAKWIEQQLPHWSLARCPCCCGSVNNCPSRVSCPPTGLPCRRYAKRGSTLPGEDGQQQQQPDASGGRKQMWQWEMQARAALVGAGRQRGEQPEDQAASQQPAAGLLAGVKVVQGGGAESGEGGRRRRKRRSASRSTSSSSSSSSGSNSEISSSSSGSESDGGRRHRRRKHSSSSRRHRRERSRER